MEHHTTTSISDKSDRTQVTWQLLPSQTIKPTKSSKTQTILPYSSDGPHLSFAKRFCFVSKESYSVQRWGEEWAGLCASRAFVRLLTRVSFCPFSLPLDVRDWLRLMIVARHGLSINFELRHEKTCFCPMRTTKAQISLRIRAVWSAPLLFAA